jgi:hypothetical protein
MVSLCSLGLNIVSSTGYQQYIWHSIAWQSVLDYLLPSWQLGNPMNNSLTGKCSEILLERAAHPGTKLWSHRNIIWFC